MRDFWLDDDQPGCLECGALVFRASKVSGVCAECISGSSVSASSHDLLEESYSFADYSISDGDDTLWTESY